ncbi:MAG: vitamin B12-dependent ribonucleotide reductase [Chloroflexi bacterium]|nr:vitamin B12-dependent ribonucleotide reductase [Chloroflexota bacterium]
MDRERPSKNAQAVLHRRYLAKDRQGKVTETPDEMFHRVAHNLAQAEHEHGGNDAQVEEVEERFYQMMSRLETLPNSPTLMNAGRELQQLSACFVLPVPDDMEGIFESAKQTALIHKSGGGTGFAFSRLRPESDVVGSTGGIASGPVSFIKIFDTATDVVKQGGTRRGANMGVLRVDHPDVLRFIHAKDDDRSLQNFNISVTVTEAFMQALLRGEDYDLINPRTKQPSGRLSARRVFEEMVQSAHKTGDPGIIFIDRMNGPRSNPVPKRGPIETTNPCGEQPLYPYDSCNLGSINLARHVAFEDKTPVVDWKKLERTVHTSVRLLDNVVTMNRYPVPQIADLSRSIRRIGLGVMGWADLLILLGVPYDSQESLDVAEKVMAFIQRAADGASEELATERGVFPDWEDSVYGPNGALGTRRLRNSTRTTIAPTGTISIIANCSSGIEPLFALSYVRNVMDNTRLVEVNPYFEEAARQYGFHSDELMRTLAERGTCRDLPQVPAWAQRVFATAHDITPEWHIRIQAAFQKHTDNAVSKTCNFRNEAQADDVEKAYRLAYELGCKGVTIYRDGSKSAQVLSTGHTEKVRATSTALATATPVPPASQALPPATTGIQPRDRPVVMQGLTERVRTGHGTLYVTINFDERGQPFEVFSTLGKSGGCDAAQLEAISRLVSLALRSGVDAAQIVDQLRGITCCPIWEGGTQVRSAPDAMALALGRHVKAEAAKPTEPIPPIERVGEQQRLFSLSQGQGTSGPAASHLKANDNGHTPAAGQLTKCPDCNGALVYAEGCLMCHSCGFNKCG